MLYNKHYFVIFKNSDYRTKDPLFDIFLSDRSMEYKLGFRSQ